MLTWPRSDACAPSPASHPAGRVTLLRHKASARLLPPVCPSPFSSSPQDRVGCKQEEQPPAETSGRWVQLLGSQETPQAWHLQHGDRSVWGPAPRHGDLRLPRGPLPALVKGGLAVQPPAQPWAQGAQAGRQGKEGTGPPRVTQQERFNHLPSSCRHSIILPCTSSLEPRPKNPPAAGQSPPGPRARRGSSAASLQ